MHDLTKQLAQLIVSSRPSEMPDRVIEVAQHCVLHWIGCSIAGSGEASVNCALAAVNDLSGPRVATVLGRREKLDIAHAALVNGISADVLSFSDTHPVTLIHAGGVIGSAALSLAERDHISGRDFLHAFIVGFEVACRIGMTVNPWHYARGWHITGTAGIFGAAAAVGKMLDLDEQRMTWALGIAATQSAGLREMFGTMSKNLHIGRAAQGGLMSALLASNGFTSSEQSLEGPRGFAHILGESPNLENIIGDFGQKFEILSNTYKPYPCGVVMHAPIEACITLIRREAVNLAELRSIRLFCNPLVGELTGKTRPSNQLEAKLSVFHAAAAALVRRRVGLEEFEEKCITDPDVLEIRGKVELVLDPEIREDECLVAIGLNNGKEYRHHLEHVAGSAARPMSDGDMQEKFRMLAATALGPEQIERLVLLGGDLANLKDAGDLARSTIPA